MALDMPRSLLLVEDNPADVLLVEDALECLSVTLRMEVAWDGVEALERLRSGPCPDLVLMDVNMPRVTGLEVLDALQTCPTEARVVLWSTARPQWDVDRAIARGAAAYLQKPNAYDDLVALLADLLDVPAP